MKRDEASYGTVKRQGVQLGRYDLLFKLGEGGSGKVYLAFDHELSGLVACKVYPPSFAEDEEGYHILQAEARAGFRLLHPGIPRFLSFSRIDGLYVLGIEYIFGMTLIQLLVRLMEKGKRPAFGVTANLFAKVCAPLHASHELKDAQGNLVNLVHRDIAPQNIMIGYDGRVSLIDFGVLKANDRGYSTTTGIIKGRAMYGAPEQELRQPVDRRADLYSLGVVLWEFLAQKIFRAHDDYGDLIAPSGHRVSEYVAGLPEALNAICTKAIQPAPERRFQTAQEMQNTLRAFSKKQPQDSVKGMISALFPSAGKSSMNAIDGKRTVLKRLQSGRISIEKAQKALGFEPAQDDLMRGVGDEPDLLGQNVISLPKEKDEPLWMSQSGPASEAETVRGDPSYLFDMRVPPSAHAINSGWRDAVRAKGFEERCASPTLVSEGSIEHDLSSLDGLSDLPSSPLTPSFSQEGDFLGYLGRAAVPNMEPNYENTKLGRPKSEDWRVERPLQDSRTGTEPGAAEDLRELLQGDEAGGAGGASEAEANHAVERTVGIDTDDRRAYQASVRPSPTGDQGAAGPLALPNQRSADQQTAAGSHLFSQQRGARSLAVMKNGPLRSDKDAPAQITQGELESLLFWMRALMVCCLIAPILAFLIGRLGA